MHTEPESGVFGANPPLASQAAERNGTSNDAPRLAVFGAQPVFEEQLHVGRPNLGLRRRFLERVEQIFKTRWLTNNGPFATEFEQRIAEHLGVNHCVATCNGTLALEIAIRALNLEGEVIVPSFTFVATAHALQWQQIKPVFCDVAPGTYTLDPAKVEALITPRTTAIIGVHTFGRSCDTERLSKIAEDSGLKLLFDAAHAFACTRNGRMIGSFGDAEVLSFHATKFINTFEGGAIVTNNDAVAETARMMRNFGFVGEDDVQHVGTNGKMSEISAAMGLTNLESLDDILAVNYRNFQRYKRVLERLPGLRIAPFDEEQRQNYQYLVVEVDEDRAGLTREELIEILRAENVRARRYFYPGCHRMEPYRSLYPTTAEDLPETEALASRVLLLPTGTAVGHDDIQKIGHILSSALQHAPAVRKRLNHLRARRNGHDSNGIGTRQDVRGIKLK